METFDLRKQAEELQASNRTSVGWKRVSPSASSANVKPLIEPVWDGNVTSIDNIMTENAPLIEPVWDGNPCGR